MEMIHNATDIDFSVNTNYLGPPETIRSFMEDKAADILTAYPGGNYGELDMSAISEFYSIDAEKCAYSIGATEALIQLPMISRANTVYSFSPSFWEYKFAAKRHGLESRQLSTQISNPEYDFSKLNEVLYHHPGLIYLGHPNNPTSALLNPFIFEDILGNHQESHFVIDETYLLFNQEFKDLSMSSFIEKYTNLSVVSSFSKFFGLPGIRLGILLSNPEIISRFKSCRVPYSISPFVEYLPSLLLKDEEYIAGTQDQIKQLGEYVVDKLRDELGDKYQVLQPSANFVYLRGLEGSSEDTANELIKNGILVVSGAEFGDEYKNDIRFSIRSKSDMDMLVENLSNCYN